MQLFGDEMVTLIASIVIAPFKIGVASHPLLPAMLIFILNTS
ncbi:MAG: hypothetical protein ACOH2K_08350 [Burkholderiaceae bacterium]